MTGVQMSKQKMPLVRCTLPCRQESLLLLLDGGLRTGRGAPASLEKKRGRVDKAAANLGSVPATIQQPF